MLQYPCNYNNNFRGVRVLFKGQICPSLLSAPRHSMKRGVKHQNAPYLSAVNVQKLKLRKDIILGLCHKPYTGIYKQQ